MLGGLPCLTLLFRFFFGFTTLDCLLVPRGLSTTPRKVNGIVAGVEERETIVLRYALAHKGIRNVGMTVLDELPNNDGDIEKSLSGRWRGFGVHR